MAPLHDDGGVSARQQRQEQRTRESRTQADIRTAVTQSVVGIESTAKISTADLINRLSYQVESTTPIDDLWDYYSNGGEPPTNFQCSLIQSEFDIDGHAAYWPRVTYKRNSKVHEIDADSLLYVPAKERFLLTDYPGATVGESLAASCASRFLSSLKNQSESSGGLTPAVTEIIAKELAKDTVDELFKRYVGREGQERTFTAICQALTQQQGNSVSLDFSPTGSVRGIVQLSLPSEVSKTTEKDTIASKFYGPVGAFE
jgi:hypothetical protein